MFKLKFLEKQVRETELQIRLDDAREAKWNWNEMWENQSVRARKLGVLHFHALLSFFYPFKMHDGRVQEGQALTKKPEKRELSETAVSNHQDMWRRTEGGWAEKRLKTQRQRIKWKLQRSEVLEIRRYRLNHFIYIPENSWMVQYKTAHRLKQSDTYEL